jgi:uncharacterized protein YjbJ (UPF0337 family)
VSASDEEHLMGETTDKITGNAKEKIGEATDNDRLKREGKADKASGRVKEKVDDVKDTVEGAVDKVKDGLHRD